MRTRWMGLERQSAVFIAPKLIQLIRSMYTPGVAQVRDGHPLVSWDKSDFTLDASGVAGFFGGTEAVSAMATVHICKNRKWMGWYNSPGSYEVAKQYGLLTRFGFFFGGGHTDPAELLTLFELDGSKGPKFLRVRLGSTIPRTDHLAAVFVKACTSLTDPTNPSTVNARQPVGVTIVRLENSPRTKKLEPIDTPMGSPLIASLPIIVSVGTCIMSAIVGDWYSFSLILWGMFANGLSCFIIGSVNLAFTRPILAGELPFDRNIPRRDSSSKHHFHGILISETDVVLLQGPEEAAMAVALGKFELSSPNGSYFSIGLCAILLLIQFIAQLLLIPQASLFGQVMFVASLAASWCYNLYLCNLDKGIAQQEILLKSILQVPEGSMVKRRLDSWPTMVAYVLVTLVLEDQYIDDHRLTTVLDALVEDTGTVWTFWKGELLCKIQKLRDHCANARPIDRKFVEELTNFDESVRKFSGEEWRGERLEARFREGAAGIKRGCDRKISDSSVSLPYLSDQKEVA